MEVINLDNITMLLIFNCHNYALQIITMALNNLNNLILTKNKFMLQLLQFINKKSVVSRQIYLWIYNYD